MSSTPKLPKIERALVVANDQRRKYGSRVSFQVLRPQYLADVEELELPLPSGAIARLRRRTPRSSLEFGTGFELEVVGFSTAAEAEEQGMRSAQALLIAAISMNFGIRLNYLSHKPANVFDRCLSSGLTMHAEAYTSWPPMITIAELANAFAHDLRDSRVLLAMELFAASSLESNARAQFVMAVSALEPLAEQHDLGDAVGAFVTQTLATLEAAAEIPIHLKSSLQGRVRLLKKESIRQALFRLCARWFPGDTVARDELDYLYRLRSEILHDGRVADFDVLLEEETAKVGRYLRRIFATEFSLNLRFPLQ